jgi:hypothetical protein
MRLLFRIFLRLYPGRHRELFGSEMEAVFEQGAHDQRLLGLLPYTRFVLKELAGVIVGAIAAQFAGSARMEPAAPARTPDLPEEVLEAQRRVSVNLSHLLFAISHHQFREARFYSDEERKAREELCRIREKYGLGDSA